MRWLTALLLLTVVACGDDAPNVARTPVAVPPLHPSVDGYPATTVTVDAGDRPITVGVRVADTDDRRRHGLMEVPALPDGAGMLFLFEAPTDGGFWMKDTLVPLDIAWIDRAGPSGADVGGTIVATATMQPCSADPCPTYEPGTHYTAALEVPAGWLERHGISIGDPLTWNRPEESTP